MPSLIDVVLLQEAERTGKHLTMDGNMVPCNSLDCVADLERRIADAIYTRDLANTRSEERMYYNGLLKVLRQQLRTATREIKQANTKPKLREARQTGSRRSDRMLELAGIF